MNIQLILFIAVFIGAYVFSWTGNTRTNRRNYIIFMIILLILESCLRGLSVGSDTTNYFYWFQDMGTEKWTLIWQEMKERYIDMTGTEDVGFTVFNKIVYGIWPNFSFMLFISALIFFIPFSILLFRFTKDFTQLLFIFILYVSLFNMIAMSGVRKEIALGFTIGAFLFYIDKKYKLCAIMVLLGTLIHMSALLFLLIPLIGFGGTKILRPLHIIAFASIPFVLYMSKSIILFMAETSQNDKYLAYAGDAEGGAIIFTFLIELISLFCLIAFWNKSLEKDRFLKKAYAALPFFTFFAPLITNNGSMIRISQYFHIYIVLLLPYGIDVFFKKSRGVIYITCILLLLLLSLTRTIEPYHFIWNDYIPKY